MSKKIWIPKFNYYSKRLSMWQEKFWKDVTGKPFMGILDNVTGRRVFEFATFGRSGVQQSNSKLFRVTKQRVPIIQKMTAACVWNASNAIPLLPALTTQIDRAARQYDADSTGGYDTFGYAGDANNWFGVSAFGVMDATTYTDGGSTTRTIRSMHDAEAGGTGGGDVYFSLDTASVPNTDTTFKDITWDDTAGTPRTMTRSADLSTYTASLNSDTHWRDLTPSFSWTDIDANTDFVLTTG